MKLGKLDTLEIRRHYNDREDLLYHLSDVKLLLITFVKKKTMKLTLRQFVAEIYKYSFNAFSLQAQVRFLPEFVKGPNLSSLYN